VKQSFHVTKDSAGTRLDQFLVTQLAEVSRARVQELIAQDKVQVDGAAAKAARKLRAGERVEITGEAERPPLKAVAEDIPLAVVYEDEQLAGRGEGRRRAQSRHLGQRSAASLRQAFVFHQDGQPRLASGHRSSARQRD